MISFFLGSSHAYRGYDPRVFSDHGLSTFNLGSSSQRIMHSYIIAKEYISSGNTLVILDVFSSTLVHDYLLEASSSLIQNVPSFSAALKIGLRTPDPRVLNMLTLRLMDDFF